MNARIYMSSPDIGQHEEEAVLAAMKSGWIAPLGPDVDAFEEEIAAKTCRDHAVALSSGTAALHLALLGTGIGSGDVVVTSTMTFAATANAIKYVGAEPVFIDADPDTGNMDPDLLAEALEDFARRGERVAAVLPVDLLGKTVDYSAITPLADSHETLLISDAAESLGASHRGQPAGSFGVAAAVSFNGNKIMTTSGGGMLLTNDASLAARARYLATQARQPVVHYEHTEVGYNYRLSNLLAALGRAQLSRLDEMINRRRELRARYRAAFAHVEGVELFGGVDDEEDNFWLTSIVVDSERTGWTATELREWMASDDIETRPLWKPMHLQPVFASARAFVTGAAEKLFATGLTLPSGSALTVAEQNRIFDRVEAFLDRRNGD